MGAVTGFKNAIADIVSANELKYLSVLLQGGMEIADIREVFVKPYGFTFRHSWNMPYGLDVVETFVFYEAIDGITYKSPTRSILVNTAAADPALPNRITEGKALVNILKTRLEDNSLLDPDNPPDEDPPARVKQKNEILTRNKMFYIYARGKWISSFLTLDTTDDEVVAFDNVFINFNKPIKASWLLRYAHVDAISIPLVDNGVL